MISIEILFEGVEDTEAALGAFVRTPGAREVDISGNIGEAFLRAFQSFPGTLEVQIRSELHRIGQQGSMIGGNLKEAKGDSQNNLLMGFILNGQFAGDDAGDEGSMIGKDAEVTLTAGDNDRGDLPFIEYFLRCDYR